MRISLNILTMSCNLHITYFLEKYNLLFACNSRLDRKVHRAVLCALADYADVVTRGRSPPPIESPRRRRHSPRGEPTPSQPGIVTCISRVPSLAQASHFYARGVRARSVRVAIHIVVVLAVAFSRWCITEAETTILENKWKGTLFFVVRASMPRL